MTDHAVIIVGGGPTGMMLGAELTLAGINVAIVERRAEQELIGSRAGGLHARTIELLDQRGIVDRFLAEGQTTPNTAYAYIPLKVSDMPTRHNYVLALWQKHFERILAGWVAELGVSFYRGQSVVAFTQDEHGVELRLDNNQTLHTDYLVGCDGGRSTIRKAAGIDFPGWEPSTSCLIAEIETTETPEFGFRQTALGVNGIAPMGDGKQVRIVLTEDHGDMTHEPTLDDLKALLLSVYGRDFGVHSPTWLSRFTDMTRQAASYRDRRILLAGDAAHVHFPVGGQGLNLGVQDAVNLGWKLAQVVKGISPDTLLDTYQSERHPVAARVLRHTMAQTPFTRSEPRINALRETMTELLNFDEPRRHFVAMITGLDIQYNLGEGHPLLGRRMPDLDLETTGGLSHVYAYLHQARPILLNLGEPGTIAIAPWADRVPVIDAACRSVWEVPAIGTVTAPDAVLIRPDGYVAWVGDQLQKGLADVLTLWFGSPATI